MPLRRAGTVQNAGARYGPGSAAHHAVKNGALRCVGIALRLYDLPFEHRPWSTFGDADKIAPYNPLHRVPTLLLDDGEVLIESTAILDHLDEKLGPSRAVGPVGFHPSPKQPA